MKRAFVLFLLALGLLLSLVPAQARPPLPPPGERDWPPRDHFQREHPQHRLAYWYANESMAQAREAREMACGFTGQHWVLDWEVHYRWALRTTPRRVYQRIEDRERHLVTCRSRKLRDYRRDPGSYRRP